MRNRQPGVSFRPTAHGGGHAVCAAAYPGGTAAANHARLNCTGSPVCISGVCCATVPGANGLSTTGSTAVRRQSASLASTMTVRRARRRPLDASARALEVDVDTAAQEILALSDEISAALPVGHEAAERSRHLLNKAQISCKATLRAPQRWITICSRCAALCSARSRRTPTRRSIAPGSLSISPPLGGAGRHRAGHALSARSRTARPSGGFLLDKPGRGMGKISADGAWRPLRRGTGRCVGGAAQHAPSRRAGIWLLRPQIRICAACFSRSWGKAGLLLALLWATVCSFTGLDVADLWVGGLPAVLAFVLGFGQEWLYGAR